MTKPLVQATGRRKTAVARVRLLDGTGQFTLNGKNLDDYFPETSHRLRIMEPFRITELEGRYDVSATLEGGGTTGQSDALRLGISRAIVELDPELRQILKKAGLLRRDDRKVERKKPGQPKARKRFQFSKR